MAVSENKRQVVRQELALDTYLKTLLEELPDPEDTGTSERQPPQTPVPLRETVAEVTVSSLAKPEKKASYEPSSQEAAAATMRLAVMPEWAQSEFQAIYFNVGRLKLATPLIGLSRTSKFDRVVTKIPGQPSWFLGLLEDQGKKIGLLDTGQLMLGKVQGLNRDLNVQPFKSMLVTQDGNWALACDDLLTIGRLTPEQVRWRTNRRRKPWLIGTIIEELVAVVDVNQLLPRRKS